MRGSQVSVGTTATLVIDKDTTYRDAIIHIVGNAIVYFGSSAVTTSTGFYVDKAAGPVNLQVLPNETLYGIVATGTETVTVLLPDA